MSRGRCAEQVDEADQAQIKQKLTRAASTKDSLVAQMQTLWETRLHTNLRAG